jgi:hypothetical protein
LEEIRTADLEAFQAAEVVKTSTEDAKEKRMATAQ